MASTWGDAWGLAWGASWGGAELPIETSAPSIFGGGATPKRRVRRVVPMLLHVPPELLAEPEPIAKPPTPQRIAATPIAAKPIAAPRVSVYRRTRAQRDEELLLL